MQEVEPKPMDAPPPHGHPGRDEAPAGLAWVATVSFLASRAAPSAGFFVALAGGAAVARAAERHGARRGYGASLAAMVESVAIMGPARFGVPLTQAVTAPMLGRLDARGTPAPVQVLACGAVRIVQNTLTTAFFIWVILGGLDAYAGTYDALIGRLLPSGQTAALVLTGAGLVGWAVFASTVQVLVYRRALREWPDDPVEPELAAGEPEAAESSGSSRRFDPRAAAVAAVIAFALLLASTAWTVLLAIVVWLALAWAADRGDRGVLPTGLVLAGLLGGSALVFGLTGGLGIDLTLRRALRAALLVLVATWLRAAAGPDGLREVARRALRRVRRLPAVPEAASTLDRLGSERQLVAAGRALLRELGPAEKRPLPILDAVLGWVVAQSSRFAPTRPAAPLRLSLRGADGLLVVLAAAPVAALPLA